MILLAGQAYILTSKGDIELDCGSWNGREKTQNAQASQGMTIGAGYGS